MSPDIDPDSVPNDGWGFLLPQYYDYMPPTATTSATTHPPSHTTGGIATAAGTTVVVSVAIPWLAVE